MQIHAKANAPPQSSLTAPVFSLPLFIIKEPHETVVITPGRVPATVGETSQHPKTDKQNDLPKLEKSVVFEDSRGNQKNEQSGKQENQVVKQDSETKQQPKAEGKSLPQHQGKIQTRPPDNTTTHGRSPNQHIPSGAGESKVRVNVVNPRKRFVQLLSHSNKQDYAVPQTSPLIPAETQPVESNSFSVWSGAKLRYDLVNRKVIRYRNSPTKSQNTSFIIPGDPTSTNATSVTSMVGAEIHLDIKNRRMTRRKQVKESTSASYGLQHPQFVQWAGQAFTSSPPRPFYPPPNPTGAPTFATPAIFPPPVAHSAYPFFPPWAIPPSHPLCHPNQTGWIPPPPPPPPPPPATETVKSSAKSQSIGALGYTDFQPEIQTRIADQGLSGQYSKATRTSAKSSAPGAGIILNQEHLTRPQSIARQNRWKASKAANSSKTPSVALDSNGYTNRKEAVLFPVFAEVATSVKTGATVSKHSKKSSKHSKSTYYKSATVTDAGVEVDVHVPHTTSQASKDIGVTVQVDKDQDSRVSRLSKNSTIKSSVPRGSEVCVSQSTEVVLDWNVDIQCSQVQIKKASVARAATVTSRASNTDVPSLSRIPGAREAGDSGVMQAVVGQRSTFPVAPVVFHGPQPKVVSEPRIDHISNVDSRSSQNSSKRPAVAAIVPAAAPSISSRDHRSTDRRSTYVSHAGHQEVLDVERLSKSKVSSRSQHMASVTREPMLEIVEVKAPLRSHRSHISKASTIRRSNAPSQTTPESKTSFVTSHPSYIKTAAGKTPSISASSPSVAPTQHTYFETPRRSTNWHSIPNKPEVWVRPAAGPSELYDPGLPSLHPRDSVSQISSHYSATSATEKSSKDTRTASSSVTKVKKDWEVVPVATRGSLSGSTRRSSNYRAPAVESLKSESLRSGIVRGRGWVVEEGLEVRVKRVRVRKRVGEWGEDTEGVGSEVWIRGP